MFCSNCGANNSDNQQFCSQCGARLSGQQQYNQQYNQQQAYSQGMPNAYQMPFAQPMFVGGIQERNIVVALLLSFITGGIYGLYWLYCLTEDTNKLSGDPNATSGGMVILLSLITCGIYTWYWMYKRGEILDQFLMSRGIPGGDKAVLYLVLSICGVGIASYCLIQNELNKLARGY